jgi:hypothetical protein
MDPTIDRTGNCAAQRSDRQSVVYEKPTPPRRQRLAPP